MHAGNLTAYPVLPRCPDGRKIMGDFANKTGMRDIKYLDDVINYVKNKRELKALDNAFISKKIREFFDDKSGYQYKEKILEKMGKSKSYSEFSKSKEHDFLIKGVRAELRKVYGAFILEDYSKKYFLLEKITPSSDADQLKKLLLLHKSTKERISHYADLYEKIFAEVLNQKVTVMDLGCGLNPLSIVYFRDKVKKYVASDISTEDCFFIKKYFEKIKMNADVFPMDLTDEDNFQKLRKIKADVVFIFKTLDGIERIKRNITEKLFLSLNTGLIAVTFPTLSLGGKREIKVYRRLWLERMLDRLGWKWDKHLIENELLYLIRVG
jgi:hypothetical protein